MSTLELEHLKHTNASSNNITLAANGSVGVGIAAPSDALHVKGFTQVESTAGDAAYIRFNNTVNSGGKTWRAGAGVSSHGAFSIYNQTDNKFGVTVNSNGIVSKPNQPSFHAYRSSSQTISGQVVFQFTSTLHNIGSHYDISTYQFTAPVTGSYFFSFKSLLYNMNSSEYFDFFPQVNGVNRKRYEFTGNGGGHSQFDYSDVYYLNAGDTVRMTGTDRSSGTFALYANENHFSGFFLG